MLLNVPVGCDLSNLLVFMPTFHLKRLIFLKFCLNPRMGALQRVYNLTISVFK